MKKIGIYGEQGLGCHIDKNGNSVKIIFNANEKYFLNEQETKENFSRLLRKAKEEVLNTPNLSLEEYLACFGEGFLRRLKDPQKMLHHSKNKIHVFIVTGENAPCGKGTLLGDYYSKSIYLENFNPFWARHRLELKDALINNYWQKYEEKLTEPKYKTIIIETKPEYVNRIKAEFFVLNAHPERDEEFIVNTVNFDRGW